MKLLGDLFTDLKAVQEDGETLLDRTMVLYGSNLRRRQRPLHLQPADAPRRRRFPARPAPRLRPQPATIRCRTCSSPCSSAWGSRPTNSPPRRAPCRASTWREHDPRHRHTIAVAAGRDRLRLVRARSCRGFRKRRASAGGSQSQSCTAMGGKRRGVHTGPGTQQTKGKGMLMFFMHLSTGHEGIVCAMATEPIPVRATFFEAGLFGYRLLLGIDRYTRSARSLRCRRQGGRPRQSRICSGPQGSGRSGPDLQHDGESEPHRLHPVLRPKRRRIPRRG